MKTQQPPKSARWMLRLFCSEERIEELEGDLFEIYQEQVESKKMALAKVSYWWMVFRSFRRYALKNSKSKLINNMNSYINLFKHHVLIASRQLWKYKNTSAINVVGLSIGIATFISIISIVLHEISYNKQIPEKESIYRIYTSFSGTFSGTNRGVSSGVAPYFKELNPENVEAITGFHTGSFLVKVDALDRTSEYRSQKTIITDASFFEVFGQYDWLIGSPEESLGEPNKVVLSIEQAEKYFGKKMVTDYIDQPLQYNDSLTLYVSGVVKQKPGNSDFIFGDFVSLETAENTWLKERIDLTNWDNTNSSSQLWLRTSNPLNEDQKITLLDPINAKSAELEESEDWIRTFDLAPLTAMHFDNTLSIFDNRGRSAANKQMLTILIAVSVALLTLAIINFVNLEIAQLRTKMKEVGVRKVMGGHQNQLIHRFLTSSFLISLMAGLLAIPLSYLGGLLFEDYLPVSTLTILQDMHFFWVISVTILLVSLISGLYPALIFSRFTPRQAFAAKNEKANRGEHSFFIRKAFVSFQFFCSQLLIVGSLIVYFQLDYMQSQDVGFQSKNIMYIQNPWNAPEKYYDLFLSKMKEIPELSEIITQNSPPAIDSYSSSLLKFKNDTGELKHNVYRKWGDAAYLDFYEIELLAGRPVTPSKNSKEVVINDMYRKELGFSSPQDAVGANLEMSEKNYQIVGVMKDFHNFSMAHEMEPVLFQYSETKYGIAAKFDPANLDAMVDKVTAAHQAVYPNHAAEINFQDQTLLEFYQNEEQMAQLTGYATVVAVLISCMGLFGLISLSIEHKTKEIGIRKVLGANMYSIAKIISKEFIILISISFLISMPVVHYFGKEWLTNYAYAIPLSWWIYAIGALLSIVIAVFVTSTKVIQATKTNPADCLRYE